MTTNAITNIPLNKLVPFAGNVRKTKNKAFIKELAASIKAHGLKQNLIVVKQGAKFAVIAGEQRMNALLFMAKAGDIKPTHPVPCMVEEGDIDPVEISLLENVMREDMHPADKFEAFRDLVDKGVPIPDIAARFGTAETYVRQLLRLARVSPAVLKAYRDDKVTLEQVKAFAVSDDHAAQDHVLGNLRPHQRDPRLIRDALTQNEIRATDRRVKFVTLKAYQKAGGQTRADLFSEGAESIFLLDTALLDKLAMDKLDRVAKELGGEGWKWTESRIDFGYQEKGQFHGVRPEAAPLPSKLAEEAEKLEAEAETLEAALEAAGEEAEYPERLEEIRERLAEIDGSRAAVWPQEKLAMAGAVVTIGDDGKPEIVRGLVRPEDMPKKAKSGKAAPGAAEGGGTQTPPMSAALTETLTAQKSAALAAALAERPDVALAAVVHALASRVLFDIHHDDRGLQLAAYPQSLHRVEGSKAFERLEAARKKWGEAVPADAEALWTWCLGQKQKVLLELLAFCAAATVNAVQGKTGRPEAKRLENAALLAAALKLDMKTWFTPDAANYFSRVSKPEILDALKEARNQPPAPAWEKLKKAELAQLAEREIAGKGWLPELLRSAA